MNVNSGYSYKITISAEELSIGHYFSGASTQALTPVQPPAIDEKRTPTDFTEMTVSNLGHFAFNKIVEPRFDGIGQYTGEPINFPDFISENHIIGIMRATEIMLAPRYEGMITGNGNSVTTK